MIKIASKVAELMAQTEKNIQSKPTDMHMVMAYIKYFLEHMEDLLLSGTNSVMKAQYFGVLFDMRQPTKKYFLEPEYSR